MADETKTTETTPEVDYKTMYEELNGKYSNLKASFDRASSDVAEFKRKERERMSEDEKRKAEDDEREQYYKNLEKENMSIKYAEQLDDISDVKIKNEIVDFFAEGKVKEALSKFKEWRVKERAEMKKTIRDELLRTNPQPSPQSSTPTARTKADIMAIKDPELRQAAIAQNIHLFQ